MKYSIIIQRLCLFLLLLISAMGAWAESSVLFNSTEQGKNKTVTTLSKSPVTITFDNCKTSGAGNIYELAKGTGLTISVTSGYRIREIVLEDTEGGNDYNNGGLDRIGAYSDASYSMAFVKNSGSQADNNNIQFRNYDAPAQSFRIVGHNMSKKGQLKIRRITVVYVEEGYIGFNIPSLTLHVGEEKAYPRGYPSQQIGQFINSEKRHSTGNGEIASCTYNAGGSAYTLKGLKVGETTFNVKGGPNDTYSSAYASIPLYVVRNDLNPSLAWTEKTMKAWEVLKFPTLENMPDDYQIGYDECTYISSDESVVKPNPGNGTLVFGGSGYGKTATISVIIPQNDKYNADTLQYTVTVDGFTFDFTSKTTIVCALDNQNRWGLFASNSYSMTVTVTAPQNVNLKKVLLQKNTSGYILDVGSADASGSTCSVNAGQSVVYQIQVTHYTVTTSTPSFANTAYTCSSRNVFCNTLNGIPTGYDGTVTYSSNNINVAEVSASGEITPTGKAGTATITANIQETDEYKFTDTAPSYTINVPLNIDADNRLMLSSATDCKTFADMVNGVDRSLNAILTRDIDFAEYSKDNNWTPLKIYDGVLDGMGYTIKNFNQGRPDASAYPLTNTLRGTIRDLTLSNPFVFVQESDLGMITKINMGSIYRVWVEGGTLSHGNQEYMGVIAGRNCGTINNCGVKGVYIANRYGGNYTQTLSGICARNFAGSVISNCMIYGNSYVRTNGKESSICSKNEGIIKDCVSNIFFHVDSTNYAASQLQLLSDRQFKNGYALTILDKEWAQKLGEIPSLFDADKTAATNYVYWKDDRQLWYCYGFKSTDYQPIGLDFYAAEAKINRTVTADRAYTVSLPCEWGNSQDTIYVLSSVNKARGIASFRQITNYDNGSYERFPAYHPYLVVPKYNNSMIRISSARMKAEPDTPVAEDVNGVQWCATYEGMTNEEAAAVNAYILQSDGMFHKVTTENTNATIPPYRAYLTIPNEGQVKALSIAFDDTITTELRAIETTDLDGTVRY